MCFSGIYSRTCASVLSNLKKINKLEVQSLSKMQWSSTVGNKVTMLVILKIFLKYVLWCNLEVEVLVAAVNVCKGLYLLPG